MTVVGQAVVRVVPDAQGFDQELRTEVEAPVGASAKRIAGLLGGAFALSQVKDFFVDTIGLASDLGESASKVDVVFGDASASVRAFAADAAEGIGQSENQALEAVGTFGNLLRSLELTEAQSAEMSTTMVGLASDLASFNNADPTEVLDALRAGLVGEAEPLKRFGININAARIETEALALGLGDAEGELDAAAKAQATYSLILKDSTLAQGDFTRTSDGLANTQRILTARWADAKTEIGQGLLPLALELANVAGDDLLPAITELAQAAVPLIIQAFQVANPLMGGGLDILTAMAPVITTLVGVIDAIPDPVLQLAALAYAANRGIGGVVTTTSRLAERLSGLATIDWSGQLTGQAAGATSALSKVNVAALGVTAAVAAGVFIYGEATKASREYDSQVKELSQSLQDVAGGQSDVNDVVREFLESEFEDFGAKGVETLNAFGLTFQDLEDAITTGGDVLDPFRDKVRELGIDLNGVDFGKLDDGAGLAGGGLQRLADELDISAGQLADLIDEIEDYDNATQDAAEAELNRLIATGELTAADRDAYVQQTLRTDGTENFAGALQAATTNLELLAGAEDEAAGAGSDLDGAMGGVTDEADEQAEALAALNDEMSTMLDNILAAAGAELDYEDALVGTAEGMQELMEAELNLLALRDGGGARLVREAELELAEARRSYQEVANDTEASELDLVRAADAVAEAEANVTEAKFADQEATEELAEALRDAERDTMKQAEAAVALAEKTAAAEGKTLSWEEKNRILREELDRVRGTLAPGSPLFNALTETITKLDTIPGEYHATITADGSQFRAEVDGLLRQVEGLSRASAESLVRQDQALARRHRGGAHGFLGTVSGNNPLVVGEGPNPEDVLVVPQSLGGLDRVIGELAQSIAGGGGGETVQLVMPPGIRESTAVATAVAAVAELKSDRWRRGK
jgi:hypothetical protein